MANGRRFMKNVLLIVATAVIGLSTLISTFTVSAQVKKKRKPVQKKAVLAGTSADKDQLLPCTRRKTGNGETYLVGGGKLSSEEKSRLKDKGILWVPTGETDRAKEIRKEAEKRGAALLAKINQEVDQWKKDNPGATAEEVAQRRRDKIKEYEDFTDTFARNRVKLPKFDWRTILDVGTVMNQGGCDLCWAFASTAAASCSMQKNYFDEYWLNGHHFDEFTFDSMPGGGEFWFFKNIALPQIPRSHVQDLLNCMAPDADQTDWCKQGWHGRVFQFMVYGNGIPAGKLNNIPEYKLGGRTACAPAEGFIKAHTWNYVNAPVDQMPTPEQLKIALIKHGPIVAPMDSDNCFNRYKSGVFNEKNGISNANTVQENRNINHVVLIIGWDDTKGEKGAWLIKNSWGKDWGEQGFGWVEYGSNNIGLYSAWVDVVTDYANSELD